MLMSSGYFGESLKGTSRQPPSSLSTAVTTAGCCPGLSQLVPACKDATVGLPAATSVPAHVENTSADHPEPLATVLGGNRSVLARTPEKAGRTAAPPPQAVLYRLLTAPAKPAPILLKRLLMSSVCFWLLILVQNLRDRHEKDPFLARLKPQPRGRKN